MTTIRCNNCKKVFTVPYEASKLVLKPNRLGFGVDDPTINVLINCTRCRTGHKLEIIGEQGIPKVSKKAEAYSEAIKKAGSAKKK